MNRSRASAPRFAHSESMSLSATGRLQRGVNRAIRHSHGAVAEFPQRSIVASLDPVDSRVDPLRKQSNVSLGSSASSNPTRSRQIMQRPRPRENPPSSRVPHSGQTAALIACACIKSGTAPIPRSAPGQAAFAIPRHRGPSSSEWRRTNLRAWFRWPTVAGMRRFYPVEGK